MNENPEDDTVSEYVKGDVPIMNLPQYKDYRYRLRKEPTLAEYKLWYHLRASRLRGRKFRRQHSVGKYILDFYCPSENLAVELDGPIHDHPLAKEYDWDRDDWIKSKGIKVIRFKNEEVFHDIASVLDAIARCFDHPNPP